MKIGRMAMRPYLTPRTLNPIVQPLINNQQHTLKFLSFHSIFPKDSTSFPQALSVFSTECMSFSTRNHGVIGYGYKFGDFRLLLPGWVKKADCCELL